VKLIIRVGPPGICPGEGYASNNSIVWSRGPGGVRRRSKGASGARSWKRESAVGGMFTGSGFTSVMSDTLIIPLVIRRSPEAGWDSVCERFNYEHISVRRCNLERRSTNDPSMQIDRVTAPKVWTHKSKFKLVQHDPESRPRF
jgi:hypothetical protein